jgi:GTP diphosphokinase / guanosine-3',5'-bis(diphosphate) 3'-diphosphatase
VESFGLKTVEDLIISIGYGKITPLQLVRKLAPKTDEEEDHQSLLNRLMGRVRKKRSAAACRQGGGRYPGPLRQMLPAGARGCDRRLYHAGFRGDYHRSECVNAIKTNPERLIEVEWDLAAREPFPVKIRIRAMDRIGLLADVAANISKCGANIISANTQTSESKMVASYFTLEVGDIAQLDQVLSSLRKIKNVLDVERVS